MRTVHDQRLLALVGCIRGIVLEFDGEARYLNAWADDPALLARPPELMIGNTIDDVLGPEIGAPFTSMIGRVFATGIVEHLEYPLDLDSGQRWFFADVKRVGTPKTGMTVVMFARDITERKATEEELARSEERYRLAAQATNDVLWDWNLVRDAVTWNTAVTTVLGYDRIADRSSWWQERVHPDDRAKVMAGLNAALSGDASAWSDRYRFARADGGYSDFIDRGFIARDDCGRPQRMVGSMTDVTHVNRLQAQLVHADRLAALGALAAGVGHEINNPLCYLIGNLENAIEMVDEAGDLRDALEEALDGGRRIAEIVKSLRTFTPGDDRDLRNLDVRDVLEAAIKMADKEIRQRARLMCSLGSVPLRVQANTAKLAQVFLSLLVNAAQSIHTGKPEDNQICIRASLDDHDRVVVSVEDSGSGIAPEHVARVFDPFFTTKPIGTGTGLGLAISHQLVASLGGDLAVTTALGKGSTFTVTIPGLPTRRTRLPRVLVIDDELPIGRLVERSLRKEAEVVVLTSAREGLARLTSAEHFDVVLCDLMMPEMTGIELYTELRRTHPDVLKHVFFMTGGACTAAAQEFLDTIGKACIDKPFARGQLLSLLSTVT